MEAARKRYFRAQTHLEKTTVTTRTSILKRFEASLPAGVTLGLVNAGHIERFLEMKSRRTKQPVNLQTRHGYLGALRYFFSWCVEQKLLTRDPSQAVKLPALGRRIPEFLTPAEYHRFMTALDAVYEERRNRPDKRYRIAEGDVIWIREPVAFALATGLRISDVVRLRWDQVRLDAGIIQVDDRTKTGNEYVVPIFDLAARVLETQLAKRKAPGEPGEDLVFRAQRHGRKRGGSGRASEAGRLSKTNLQTLFRAVRDAARLPKNISFHSLRHTFATWMLMQTNNIRLVSALLGHTNLDQTQDYAHVALLAMRSIRPQDFEEIGVSWHRWQNAGAAAGSGRVSSAPGSSRPRRSSSGRSRSTGSSRSGPSWGSRAAGR